MRYSAEHKAETRRRIVEAAASLFRERGPNDVGLPEIMESAGLTVGGFYRHFESKDELFLVALEEGLRHTVDLLRSQTDQLDGQAWIDRVAALYLHPKHRDNLAGGCPLPTLTSEIARRPGAARRRFQETLRGIIDDIEGKMPETSLPVRQAAWVFLATLVGGLLLARGVEDDELAVEILRSCRRAVGSQIDQKN